MPRPHDFAGIYDAFGRELTHGHLTEILTTLLGEDLMDLAAQHHHLTAAAHAHRKKPDHPIHTQAAQAADDLASAAHGRLKGQWTLDRYSAPIEHYAYRAMHNVGYGVAVSDEDAAAVMFHDLPASVRVAADAAMKKDQRAQRTEWDETFDNLFMTQGVSTLWNQAANGGTTNTGGAVPGQKAWYNGSQSCIGVGDSTSAPVATQFDLQAATNRLWVLVDATFPTLPSTTSNAIVFRATFGGTLALYSWQEFGVCNDGGSNVTLPSSVARSAANGSMLDRVTSSQGTKANGQTFQPTMTLTIS